MRKFGRIMGTVALWMGILLIVTVVVLMVLEPTPWVCRSDKPSTDQLACQ